MKLHELSPAAGSTKERKRIGRGAGSGQGKTAGKGHKGQKARAGRGMRPGFEGGQMPLQRRVPKRGFNNIFRTEMAIVNVAALEANYEAGAVVTIDSLKKALLRRYLTALKFLVTVKSLRLSQYRLTLSANLQSRRLRQRAERPRRSEHD